MNLLLKFNQLIQSKHGRSIVVAGIAILVTVLTLSIAAVASGLAPSETKKQASEQVTSSPPSKSQPSVEPEYGDVDSQFSDVADPSVCDNRFPDNGFKRVFRKDWERSSSRKTELMVDNKTANPIWVRLLHPDANFPIYAVMVYPFQAVTKPINTGIYAVDFTTGTKWCNASVGINPGKTMALASNIPMSTKNSVMLRIMADNQAHLDALVTQLPRIPKGTEASPMLVPKD